MFFTDFEVVGSKKSTLGGVQHSSGMEAEPAEKWPDGGTLRAVYGGLPGQNRKLANQLQRTKNLGKSKKLQPYDPTFPIKNSWVLGILNPRQIKVAKQRQDAG